MKFFAFVMLSLIFCAASADPTVVFSSKATGVEKTAVRELTDVLSRILGREVKTVEEGQPVPPGRLIYTGWTNFASRHMDCSKFRPEESLIKSVGPHLIITGGRPRGTFYGVCEFLERFGRVIHLNEKESCIPKNPQLSWPGDLNIKTLPVFRCRGIYVHGLNVRENREELLRYLSRCRENMFWQGVFTTEERERWGITPILGRPAPLNTLHCYSRLWPKTGMESARSLNTAGERDISRNYSGPGQICFSSELARKTIAEQMLGFIAQDRKEFPGSYPLFYNLSINDTPDRCLCGECLAREKKYKSYAGTVLEFVNSVAEKVGAVYPDVFVQTSAYLFTEKAPEGIKPRNNVIVRVSPSPYVNCCTMLPLTAEANKATLSDLKKWSALGKIHVWNYWVVYGQYAGRNACVTNIPALQTNLQLFRKLGSDYCFSECEFPESASFHTLRVYLGYQLLRDPYQELEPLLKRFFDAYFGPAASAMRQFFDYQTKRQTAEMKTDTQDASQRPYLDMEFFQFAERCFQAAEKAAGNDQTYLFRIRRERVPVDTARLSMHNLPPAPKIADRLKKNWAESMTRHYGKEWPTSETSPMNALFQKVNRPATGAKYPLPKELASRVCYEITWPEFNALTELASFGLRLVKDPEAAGGKAMYFEKPLRSPEKGFHTPHLRMGVFSRSQKEYLLSRTVTLKSDEKYHLYRVGVSGVDPMTVLLLHPTWQIRHHLDRYYEHGKNNRFDIWVSVKATGPAYEKNSKHANALWIDRILLLLPEDNGPQPQKR